MPWRKTHSYVPSWREVMAFRRSFIPLNLRLWRSRARLASTCALENWAAIWCPNPEIKLSSLVSPAEYASMNHCKDVSRERKSSRLRRASASTCVLHVKGQVS